MFFEGGGPEMFTFGLSGCRVLTAPKPPGFTRQPENSKREHFRAPALQTPPKEGRMKENGSGKRKKTRNFGQPTLWGPTLRDPSLRDPSLRDPSLRDPSLRDPSLQDPSLSVLSSPSLLPELIIIILKIRISFIFLTISIIMIIIYFRFKIGLSDMPLTSPALPKFSLRKIGLSDISVWYFFLA